MPLRKIWLQPLYSQNGWGWKRALEILSNLPCSGYLEPTTQDNVQIVFYYLQGQRLHNLPGQSVPVLSEPRSKKKKKRKSISWCSDKPFCVSVCAHCIPSLDITSESLALSSTRSPFRYCTLRRSSPSLLFFRLSHSSCSLFSHDSYSNPFISVALH